MAAMAGSGAIVRQGHLRKLKTMRKKYFVLRADSGEASARLEYYESEKKFRAGAAPRRVLPLKSCYNITRRLDLKQKHVIALFTREEQLCIVADNEQDLHAWLAAILKQHRSDDASQELLHPIPPLPLFPWISYEETKGYNIQEMVSSIFCETPSCTTVTNTLDRREHVWQVNVQKKGLGASKNIQGLYNLCLTDKTVTLVKIKSHNNIISDLGIPERVEYSLKNIRRCGDSECFFYMEVGRQTATGSGELWMHSDDSNIAQSMHSTILHAMRNCAKETENEKDHIVVSGPLGLDGSHPLPERRQSFNSPRLAGLYGEKSLCVGSCIRQCVCASAAYSLDDAAPADAETLPPNNTLTSDKGEIAVRAFRHHRTESLPAGCPSFQEPLKISHMRTFSAPLTGDEVDRAIVDKALHGSCRAVNGAPADGKKAQWAGRRASTGARLSKLSPAHTKNVGTPRNRCDSMPSRPFSSFEGERPPPRHTDLLEGLDSSRDDIDSVEWYGTPRIPEEPDSCDILSKDFINMTPRGSSVAHSRTSSFGADDPIDPAESVPDGYVPMAPRHDLLSGLVSSSGSVYSGTPSTDPRFSEYPLEPAVSHIAEERSTRAYSVGSRPGPRAEPRMRAYSAGARRRPAAPPAPHHAAHHTADHMELDFSANSPSPKVTVARTPPKAGFAETRARTNVDEYVDMSPRNAGYVDMRPGDLPAAPSAASTPDGYVEMSYGRAPTRPIAIAAPRAPPPAAAASPDDARLRRRDPRTPSGSQTIFPISLDSPASPPDLDAADFEEDPPHHALTTVREISEDGRRSPETRRSPDVFRRSPDRTPEASVPPEPRAEVSCSPQYVTLMRPATNVSKPPLADDEICCNPTANKTIVRPIELVDNRADVPASGGPPGAAGGALHYAALDLEPRRAAAAPAPRLYTQIDFLRSEQMHADAT